MAQLNLRVEVRRRWWATGALRALYGVYWVSSHFMTQKQAEAFADRCINFVAKHGVVAKVIG